MTDQLESSRSFVQAIVDERFAANPRLSMRAIANKTGVSVSTISDFLSGKRNLSKENALRLVPWLKIDRFQREFFLEIIDLELAKSKELKFFHQKEVNRLRGVLEGNATIQNVLDTHQPVDNYRYIGAGALNIRALTILEDKSNGNIAFIDRFVQSDRGVSSTGYFLPNADGTYRLFLDESLDGTLSLNDRSMTSIPRSM